jgi:hypothetical protein
VWLLSAVRFVKYQEAATCRLSQSEGAKKASCILTNCRMRIVPGAGGSASSQNVKSLGYDS